MLRIIDVKEIVDEVKGAVAEAKKEILTTMHLGEELSKPLPIEYFKLLLRKMTEDKVTIKRQSFGTKEEFALFEQQDICKDAPEYTHTLRTNKDYKRMICIDRKKLFFKPDNNFMTTTDENVIESYLKYFEQ